MRKHSREYLATLASEGWRRFSARVRGYGLCTACRRRFPPNALQTHHWHYERLGLEGVADEWDVSPLCAECHPLADSHRAEIVAAAKRYAAAAGDEHWRRAVKLTGEAYVALLGRPMMREHRQITLKALPFLSLEP